MPYGSLTAQSFALASIFGSAKRSGAPVTCYFALLYTASQSVIGTEPTDTGGYARVGILNDDSLWTIVDDSATNEVEIRWPLLSAPWTEPLINQWAIYDAATAGTCWAFGEITFPIDTDIAGRQPVAAVGSLSIGQDA